MAPDIAEVVVSPLFVDSEQSEVVALQLVETSPFLVGQALFVFRPIKHILHRQHGYDADDLVTAGQVHTGQQHFGQLGL